MMPKHLHSTKKNRKGANQKARNQGAPAPSYVTLVKAFPIRPIRSEKALDGAIAMVDGLLSRPLDRHEKDYLEVLGHEIERYESTAYPMPAVSAADMVKHLLDAKGVTLSEAARETGIIVSTLSAVVHGKRKLNLSHVRSLAVYFGVEPGVFLD